MADRILVSTEQITATVGKYEQELAHMEQALQAMDRAWDTLCNVWDGTIKATFMSEWVVIMGNIKKSTQAMNKSINGLKKANDIITPGEDDIKGNANSLSEGPVPPMF